MNKEIEEMTDISKIICNCIADCQQLKGYCGADDMAVYLYNAGYTKFDRADWVKREYFDNVIENAKMIKQEVIKEFAEKLRAKLIYVRDCDGVIRYRFYQDDLDEIFKEYGVDLYDGYKM